MRRGIGRRGTGRRRGRRRRRRRGGGQEERVLRRGATPQELRSDLA